MANLRETDPIFFQSIANKNLLRLRDHLFDEVVGYPRCSTIVERSSYHHQSADRELSFDYHAPHSAKRPRQ